MRTNPARHPGNLLAGISFGGPGLKIAGATIFLLVSIVGCKRKDEPNKILDPLPVNSVQTCTPAQISQGWFLSKRDCLRVLMSVINRTTLHNTAFPELTPTGVSSEYTFQTSNEHYGTAVFRIQGKNDSGGDVDIESSSATLKSVNVSVTMNGSLLFTGTETLVLTLDTTGNLDSPRRLTGTSTLSGSSNSLTYTIVNLGLRCAFEGLVDGEVRAAGTGPGGSATAIKLDFAADHTANGTISWEGLNGGLHLDENGSGYVVTNQYRLLLN